MNEMEIASLKLDCLRLADGSVSEAEKKFAFVSGSKPNVNAPIHAAEGNAEQAAYSKAKGESYRTDLGAQPLKAETMNNIASPDTSDSAIEREIIAKGKTAARITPADLQANIVSEHYFTAAEGEVGAISSATTTDAWDVTPPQELSLLTFCVLILRNGFTVTGESACASPENFDAEIGRMIARENAVQKVWPLMGYALKQQLHAAQSE